MTDLRLDHRTAALIEWYFCAAESDQGIRSSYESMVNAPPSRFPARLDRWTTTVYVHGGSRSGRPTSPDEHVLEAADRARHVEHALRQLDPAHVRALRLYFTIPAGKRHPAFGRLTWVVGDLSPVARAAWRDHSRQRVPLLAWLARLGAAGRDDRSLVKAITRDAESLVSAAVIAFEAARVRRRRSA